MIAAWRGVSLKRERLGEPRMEFRSARATSIGDGGW
jgi:hypothetical protein